MDYLTEMEKQEILEVFSNKLESMEELNPEFIEVINRSFWDLIDSVILE